MFGEHVFAALQNSQTIQFLKNQSLNFPLKNTCSSKLTNIGSQATNWEKHICKTCV